MKTLVFYGTDRRGGWSDFFRTYDNFVNAKHEVRRLKANYPDEMSWAQFVKLHDNGRFEFIEEWREPKDFQRE